MSSHFQYNHTLSFDYVIKRQRRKTIALHVLDDASVELRAPNWVPKYELASFVEERADWVIQQRCDRLDKLRLKPRFANRQYHPYLGNDFPLQVLKAGRSLAVLQDGALVVKVRDPQNEQQVEKAMTAFYRREAQIIYEERLFACFEAFPHGFQDQFVMPSLTIRSMKRRWGSCSSRGDITLNLWLIKMPISCIDYVITHELCHLQVFDHGKRFYDLLAQVMPDWREQELLIEKLATH